MGKLSTARKVWTPIGIGGHVGIADQDRARFGRDLGKFDRSRGGNRRRIWEGATSIFGSAIVVSFLLEIRGYRDGR